MSATLSVVGGGGGKKSSSASSTQLRPQQRRGRRKRPSLVFRLNDHTGSGPDLLREVFLERGWREFDDDAGEELDADTDWNLWWRSSRFRACDYASLRPWQRLNHYPKSTAITKKDCLARNMRRMKAVHGATVYSFSPVAYNLPNDYTKFVGEYSKSSEKAKKMMYWICKPADMSRGRGIFLFRELSDLQYDCNAVVQEYITNPMLISGYKFDLRIYVMVPSFQPLQVYIYQEGLVRFSTEKFDLSSLGNVYSHLTNTSINKHSPGYNIDKESIGAGCKWTLTQLRHFFVQSFGVDDLQLWGKIINIVILTLLVQASQVPKASNCFELYGFDILIDDNLKPWLLEVNFSPALSSDCQADIQVKKPLMHDLIEMLGFTEQDKMHGENLTKSSKPTRGLHSGSRGYTPLGHRPPSRLPNIPYTPSTSTMSTTSQVSWPSTFMEEEEEVEDDDGDSVVPLVPGCGLPSVQHQGGRQQHHQATITSPAADSYSSGRSTASPAPPADLPEPYPRVPAISPSRKPLRPTSNLSNKAKRTNASTVKSTKPNRLTAINRNKNNTAVKRKSKVSVTSDSGVSSFSGSSESSDPHLDEDKLRQHNLRHSKLTNNAAKKFSSSSRADLAEEGLNSAPVRAVPPRSDSRKSRPASLSSSRQPVKASSIPGHTRPSLPPHRLPNYAKPWRERGGASEDLATATMPKQLPNRVGDFVLVWPFNEASRKCSNSNGEPDPRVVIKECQRLLRDRQTLLSSGAAGQDQAASKVPVLWGPLRVDPVAH